MTLIVLVVLLLLAMLAGWVGRYRLARSLAGLALLLLLVVACGPLPCWLLDHLQRPYAATAPANRALRNAIVLLGASTPRMPGTGILEPTPFAYGRA